MYNFKRVSDDSSLIFKIDCQSSYFNVHNFDFYADFSSFKSFLPNIKKIYKELSGKATIKQTYEESIIEIEAEKSGRITVFCKAYYYDEFSGNVKIGFELDQTFLPKFIAELEEVYNELKL